MNKLLSIRTNIFYSKKEKKSKKDPDEFVKYNELIFLVDKPKYTKTNSGESVREKAIEDLRLTISADAFDELIKLLIKLKDIDESELY